MSKFIPLADDLAIEADSGGHTTQGVSFSLIPAVVSLKDIMKRKYKYQEEILVGCGGGIGTPDAAASAFTLGADFIFTGSINQCTAESGAHSVVKDILNTVSIHDTAITAAGDMFEIGAKVQVVKKGTQYAVRANKLYQLFRQYNSFEEIPEQIRLDIERNYFKKTFSQVLDLVYEYKSKKNPEQLKEAEENPRFKMALIFKWYFSHCSRSTLNGDLTEKDNFVIYCGPAQGAFNQWVKGTRYEHWKNRHVDEIAGLLMHNACKKLWDKNSLVMHDGFQIESHSIKDNTDTAIAVIGMAGQFPKSSNLEQFWENIKNGVNCISEVPETRWQMDKYFDPDPKAQGKTYSKWMGVLEDADKFDPLFFNISPAEAELMDPQQRLFLENCWSCIEDAGITPSSLSGTRCGVFVGCASGEYQELADEYGLNAQA
ncbi:beta-ketoacyl synthase N-terminal-like domain-containing protein [Ruminiclostridium josui]|uniref:beta-ketoacyl synthase N-terminal-like domain-containing protein n=1 Tax=Ruminiclostridium josui TaxID=1499 RepID=UPI0006D13EF9|nr:beta-ketoacyl synthase N-terminal-like domain-containing protein [Ruminiclostridium josui]